MLYLTHSSGITLQEETKGPCQLLRGGLLVHPSHPYLAASLDYLQTVPDVCIVEIKSWQTIPETLPSETEWQVVMQLAIAAASPLIDWKGGEPKAVVVAASDNAELHMYPVPWDAAAKQLWNIKMLPKAHNFYLHALLPRVVAGNSEEVTQRLIEIEEAEPPSPPPPATQGTSLSDAAMEDAVAFSPGCNTVGKRVTHKHSGKVGKVIKVINDDKIVVAYDGEEQKRAKPSSIDYFHVWARDPEDIIPPTCSGQRVLVVCGTYHHKYGILEIFNL